MNKYHVVIDCVKATLSLELNNARATHQLACPKPTKMTTIELWEKPSFAAIQVEEKNLTVEMVPVVCEYPDVFPKELLGLPPMREVEFGIEVMPGTTPISKQAYRMAPVETSELKSCNRKGLSDLASLLREPRSCLSRRKIEVSDFASTTRS